MADARMSDGTRLRRRWSFADCIFDEANWTLLVGGRRVPVETKPLELLRELLLNAGTLVSKDDLLNAIWRDVIVVEASLPTAVSKLRAALNDDRRATQIIETVPRIGYRLSVPVEVEELTGPGNGAVNVFPAAAKDEPEAVAAGWVTREKRRVLGRRGLLSIAAALAIGIGATAFTLASSREVPVPQTSPAFNQQDARNAIRRLDVAMIERMIAAGWDPNSLTLAEGNRALHYAVEMCEWNRGHDRNRLLLMVRTLYEGGARFDHRNVWGDTPYSIAKARRFCGPHHPVTRSLRASCTEHGVIMDRCLASYEIARRDRR